MSKSKKAASTPKRERNPRNVEPQAAPVAAQPEQRHPAALPPPAPTKARRAAKAPPLPKAPREERNGVKRPKEGGVCAAVWAWLDENGDHKLTDMKEVIAAKGWNQNNVSAELAGWRKFKGIARTQMK